jgi:hypothetical protein
MSVLGIATLIGLVLLGVPLAFSLALFTALMLFILYVGSVISYIPTRAHRIDPKPYESAIRDHSLSGRAYRRVIYR